MDGIKRIENAPCRCIASIGFHCALGYDRDVVVFGEMRYGPLLNLGKVAGIAYLAPCGVAGVLKRIQNKTRIARLDVVYEIRDSITVEAVELAKIFGLVDKALGFRRIRTERGKQAAQAIDVGGTVRGS